jgi:tripeptidyl-peptidase-1
MRSVFAGAVAFALLGDFVSGLQLNGWVKARKAEADAKVKMTFPVKQSNLGLVERLFWEVSNPSSTLYGKYLSFEEVGSLTQNQHASEATIAYLKALGVEEADIEADQFGAYITANVPVRTANAAFNADFHVYEHEQSDKKIVKSESADLPEALRKYVTHVPHVSYFPQVNRKVKFTPEPILLNNAITINADATATTGYVTPDLLRSYYGIDNVQVTHGATQSLFEALGQQFDNEDLNLFQKKYGLTVKNITKIIGKDVPSACFKSTGDASCGEANLDVQYIMGVAQGSETSYWNIDPSVADPFLAWVQALANTANAPQVHSISYGGYEDNSNNDMTVFNTEVQKLGLRGITVLVSSGDDGAANFAARTNASYCGYYASFPASSPYVTAVGATQGPESGKAEVVCSSQTGGVITSGGGFSSVFARPAYQNTHVSEYFSKVGTAPQSGYNANGRGYPDVAVLGYNYALAIGAQWVHESGTSASAPVFAGMITLINDARLAQGKAPLGFLNQVLYKLPASTFNDVTVGNNKCTVQVCCSEGFYAAAGWDPVTGLGTPKFQELKNALVAL